MRPLTDLAVLASVKVRNLKANHSDRRKTAAASRAVLASVKVRNLKANHSALLYPSQFSTAVLASVKVRNLKANHSDTDMYGDLLDAVLASVKVRNLKANHSLLIRFLGSLGVWRYEIWKLITALRTARITISCCISKCEGTKSES